MATRSKTLAVGARAPEFSLSTPAGEPWRLGEHLPLALFFFRTVF